MKYVFEFGMYYIYNLDEWESLVKSCGYGVVEK